MVTVTIQHSCGHSAVVQSPGPLDPEGLIKADIVKGLHQTGLTRGPCADCQAPAAAGAIYCSGASITGSEQSTPCGMYRLEDGALSHCTRQEGHAEDHSFEPIQGAMIEPLQTTAKADGVDASALPNELSANPAASDPGSAPSSVD